MRVQCVEGASQYRSRVSVFPLASKSDHSTPGIDLGVPCVTRGRLVGAGTRRSNGAAPLGKSSGRSNSAVRWFTSRSTFTHLATKNVEIPTYR